MTSSAGHRHVLTDRLDLRAVAEADIDTLHRLTSDEVFHFYLGDPVEMLHLLPDRSHRVLMLGQDLAAGMTLQAVVPGGVWQGARLAAGGGSPSDPRWRRKRCRSLAMLSPEGSVPVSPRCRYMRRYSVAMTMWVK